MGKTAILVKNVQTGLRRVFDTLEQASEVTGVSSASLSAATIDVRETCGWVVRRVDRVYALHMRVHNEWLIATATSKGNFMEYGNPARKIGTKETDEVRDVTAGWYLQEGEL